MVGELGDEFDDTDEELEGMDADASGHTRLQDGMTAAKVA